MRPTKEQALTRDLGKVLASLDASAVELIPKLIKKMKEAINDPDTKLETQYQIFKFFVAHAEKAHEERLQASEQEIKKAQEEVKTEKTENIQFFSLEMSDEDKAELEANKDKH